MVNRDIYKGRQFIILFFFGIVTIIYVIRLFFLQVIDDKWKRAAENNAIRRIVNAAPRGVIYDRNGAILVDNEMSYDLMVVPFNVKDLDTIELSFILGIDTADLMARMRKAKAYSSYVPSVLVKQLTPQMNAYILERSHKYKGFYVYPRTVRKYHTSGAAHSLGYIAEVNYNDMEKDNYYALGDYIGKSGIERYYETDLRGTICVSG